MRIPELRTTTWHRLQRPATWGAVLGFGALWLLARGGLGMPLPHWQDWLFPFAVPFAYLVISPVPWQWTGDGRALVPVPRGLLQALLWNLLWIGGVVLVLGMAQPPAGPGPADPPARPDLRPPPGSGPLPDFGTEAGGAPRGGPGPAHPQPPPGGDALLARAFHPRILAIALTNLSFAVLLGWILANQERAEAREAEALEAVALARARALQSQMSPHVLFNAISGLTELALKDPKATEEALVNLAQLLRNLLDGSTRAVDPLAAERTLVEHYLAVERIRLGARLRVAWDWDGRLEGHLIPPLLLQPLVENAIKHGIAPCSEGGDLRIFLRAEGPGLCLGVANTGAPLAEGRPEGIGLRNLRERLGLLGEPSGSLTLHREGDWTIAGLHLGLTPEGR